MRVPEDGSKSKMFLCVKMIFRRSNFRRGDEKIVAFSRFN